MPSVHVRPYIRKKHKPVPGRFSPTVLGFAVGEAEEILQEQDSVIGYETEQEAQQVQRALRVRGVHTKVIAEVGYPVRVPTMRYEAEEMHKLDIEPGARYVRWGVRKDRPSL
jgi:hypothetical protein